LNNFSHGKITNFVESACWPDDVKTFLMSSMNEWHFIDVPVYLEKLLQIRNITYKDDDAVGTIVT
jgi:hypothetical protein